MRFWSVRSISGNSYFDGKPAIQLHAQVVFLSGERILSFNLQLLRIVVGAAPERIEEPDLTIMKSKPMFLGIFMLLRLLVYQIIPALSEIVESELNSLVVERRMRKRDIFTVNMKSDHTCAEDVQELADLCTSLGGFRESFRTSYPRTCSCICWYAPFTFLPSIQRCANKTLAANFGGEWS